MWSISVANMLYPITFANSIHRGPVFSITYTLYIHARIHTEYVLYVRKYWFHERTERVGTLSKSVGATLATNDDVICFIRSNSGKRAEHSKLKYYIRVVVGPENRDSSPCLKCRICWYFTRVLYGSRRKVGKSEHIVT